MFGSVMGTIEEATGDGIDPLQPIKVEVEIKPEPVEQANDDSSMTLADVILERRVLPIPKMPEMPEVDSKKLDEFRRNKIIQEKDKPFVLSVGCNMEQAMERRYFLEYMQDSLISSDYEEGVFSMNGLLKALPREMISRLMFRKPGMVDQKKKTKSKKREIVPDLHPSIVWQIAEMDKQRKLNILGSESAEAPAVYVSENNALDLYPTDLAHGLLGTWPMAEPPEAVLGMELALNEHSLLTIPFMQLTHSCSLAFASLHLVSAMRCMLEGMAINMEKLLNDELDFPGFMNSFLRLCIEGEDAQSVLEVFAVESANNAKFALRSAVTRSCPRIYQRFVLSQPLLQGEDICWKPGDPRLERSPRELLRIVMGLDEKADTSHLQKPKTMRNVVPCLSERADRVLFETEVQEKARAFIRNTDVFLNKEGLLLPLFE